MCDGREGRLAECRNDGWGVHDCTDAETAGVVCGKENPVSQEFVHTTTAKPALPRKKIEVLGLYSLCVQ